MIEFIMSLDGWEVIGLLGAFTYTAAYIFAAYDWITSHSPLYYFLNMSAALMVLVSLMQHYNLASVVIQVFFVTVSLVGIWRHLGRQEGSPKAGLRQ